MSRPARPRTHLLALATLAIAGPALACTASFGQGGPEVGVSGAVGERDPSPSEESRREQRLRDTLQRLFRAEERYFADNGTYTAELFHLRGDGGGGLEIDPAVRVTIPEAIEEGFSAVAREAPFECALFVGEAERPRAYVEIPGVIGCR